MSWQTGLTRLCENKRRSRVVLGSTLTMANSTLSLSDAQAEPLTATVWPCRNAKSGHACVRTADHMADADYKVHKLLEACCSQPYRHRTIKTRLPIDFGSNDRTRIAVCTEIGGCKRSNSERPVANPRALEAKSAQDGVLLTEAQVVALRRRHMASSRASILFERSYRIATIALGSAATHAPIFALQRSVKLSSFAPPRHVVS